MSQPDHEPATCDNCGRDEHTTAEWHACLNSILGPPRCVNCGAPVENPQAYPVFCQPCLAVPTTQ